MAGNRSRGRVPEHNETGLQPERTSLAWTRTTMAMLVASSFFLRWLPHHGAFIGTLLAVSLCTALGINLTQRQRYRQAARGIASERLHADVAAAMWISGSVVVLAALGIYTVIFLPAGS